MDWKKLIGETKQNFAKFDHSLVVKGLILGSSYFPNDIFNNAIPTGTKRETNRYNLTSYKDNPTSDDIIKFLSPKGFDLIDQKNVNIKDSIMIFQRRNS